MPTPKSKLSKFILSLPSTLSGAQVVERVTAKGMKTIRANVSRVRGLYGPKAVKTAPTTPGAATSATTPRAAPRIDVAVPRRVTTTSSVEELLRAVAAELGLGRAVQIIAEERARVAAVLRG
jgi:hypothetical protein